MFLSYVWTELETLLPIAHPLDCAFGSYAAHIIVAYSKPSITESKTH